MTDQFPILVQFTARIRKNWKYFFFQIFTASGTFKFPFFPCSFRVRSVPCACAFHSVSTRYNRFPCRHAINVDTRFEDTEPIYSVYTRKFRSHTLKACRNVRFIYFAFSIYFDQSCCHTQLKELLKIYRYLIFNQHYFIRII